MKKPCPSRCRQNRRKQLGTRWVRRQLNSQLNSQLTSPPGSLAGTRTIDDRAVRRFRTQQRIKKRGVRRHWLV